MPRERRQGESGQREEAEQQPARGSDGLDDTAAQQCGDEPHHSGGPAHLGERGIERGGGRREHDPEDKGNEKRQSAEEQRPRDGHGAFRKLEALFINHQAHRAGDAEGDQDFQHVGEGFRFAPFKDELVNPLRKQRQHGDDRAALDDDVVEVGFVDVQNVFRNEQMAGGGNRDEFGEAFDDAENEGFEEQNEIHEWRDYTVPGLPPSARAWWSGRRCRISASM